MHPILMKLKGGDRRSVGQADEVAEEIVANGDIFEIVFNGMLCDDPVVRMRSADAVEKATRERPELLGPFKTLLLDRVSALTQQDVLWHVAQMIPRLDLTAAERNHAVDLFTQFLSEKSSILRTLSMQGLAELALKDEGLMDIVLPIIREGTMSGTPAMRARGRKLLAVLETDD